MNKKEEWQPLDTAREIKILHEGKLIVLRLKGDNPPLFCEVCSLPMRTLEDNLSYRKHKCCQWCALEWAESSFYDWESGWRPSQEQITERNSRTILKPIIFT
jgi:hypothetical protein